MGEREGGQEGGRWSVLRKSGHLPQLINYNAPGNGGWGNDEAPAVAWGEGGWRSELLWPIWWSSGQSMRIPWGWGKFSSHWQESRRPPGTSLCDAGPLVAGPHCWAWALAGDCWVQLTVQPLGSNLRLQVGAPLLPTLQTDPRLLVCSGGLFSLTAF